MKNIKLKVDIVCPMCNVLLKANITFNQLNEHLKKCGNNLDARKSERIEKMKKNKLSKNNLFESKLHSIVYNASLKKDIKSSISKQNTQRYQQKKEELSKSNEFQLVIDYNNTKNPDLYEEKLKNDGAKEEIDDKYFQLDLFLTNKKNLMDFDLIVECSNYKEIFYVIKNCNIYYNTCFIISKGDKDSSSKKTKILTLNYVLNKYLDFMVKSRVFRVLDNTLYFDFNSKEVDFEMIGIILSILFIYPAIQLKYKFPLFLCKLLVNQKLELSDIKHIDANIYCNLITLSKDKNINSKGLVYFYKGNELLIDGKNIKVTKENVSDYIEKIITFEFIRYKKEIKIIKSNLFQFLPKKYVFYFKGEEIYCLINRTI